MKKRSYKVTFGLKEGYEKNARLHTAGAAGRIIAQWMSARLAARQPIVNGLLQEGTLFYPAPGSDPAKPVLTVSPSAIFSGELSSLEDLRRKNKEIRQTLESLAEALRQGLKQESVYIIYRDLNWCVGSKPRRNPKAKK